MKIIFTIAQIILFLFTTICAYSQAISIQLPNTPIQRNSTFNVIINMTNGVNSETYVTTVTCSGCTTPSQVCNLVSDPGCGTSCTPTCQVTFTATSANTERMAFDATAVGDADSGCPNLGCAAAQVLPVELTDFTSSIDQDKVVLNWQTSAELNNYKFIIETSTEGEVFNRIGEIDGAGTTTEPQDYTFTHHTPSAGVNYYRLKQVDFDGTFAYSKVLAINAPGSKDIFAFPNPAKDKITLQYDLSKGVGNIQLFDALGRRVNASIAGYAGNYEVKLPEGLAKGTYWLKVERGGQVQTVPVVKE